MNTHGFLSIEKRITRWSRADFDAYLSAASVGILAGLAVTYIRTPLHMPGHKAVFWLTPALVCRLMTRAKAGASTSILATIAATMLLGGQLGGGWDMMPLVLLAGITLDLTVGFIERRQLSFWPTLVLLAMAGTVGNLICCVKRLSDPAADVFNAESIKGILSFAISYAVFGLASGLFGGLFNECLRGFRKRHESRRIKAAT